MLLTPLVDFRWPGTVWPPLDVCKDIVDVEDVANLFDWVALGATLNVVEEEDDDEEEEE